MKTIKTRCVSVKALPSLVAILLMCFTSLAFADCHLVFDGEGQLAMAEHYDEMAPPAGQDCGTPDSEMMLDQGGGNKKAGLPMGAMGEEEAGEGDEGEEQPEQP